jgi:hypothetical protein
MKLHDCCCGGVPQVTYKNDAYGDFVIACTNCNNSTPKCYSLKDAVSLWDQVYCRALPPNEIETA